MKRKYTKKTKDDTKLNKQETIKTITEIPDEEDM